MRLVVLGGAGYIGSHFAKCAEVNGYEVVVFDNLSTGHIWASLGFKCVFADIRDRSSLSAELKPSDIVCHFAAKSIASESVVNPALYEDNNVLGTRMVLEAMMDVGCTKIIFSSTAAVYSPPKYGDSLSENSPIGPINPYGVSKLKAESLIRAWFEETAGQAVVFRYFNACGAWPAHKLGEAHVPETHLIPNVINAILNKRNRFFLYGNKHPTLDGSCVRDYVHVCDLAEAHLLGVENMLNQHAPSYQTFNLGTGSGHSNLQVIAECERQMGLKLDYQLLPNRLGDPATLVSSSELAKKTLGWCPKKSELSRIIRDAITWHQDILPERLR